MTTTNGWGLIGTGRIAEDRILPGINSYAGNKLVGVVSRDPARAKDFAQRFQRRELPTEIETFAWSGDEQTVWICHLLRTTGLAKSTSEARRSIQQGGVRLDGAVVSDQDLQVAAKNEVVLQVGRRRVIKVVFSSASAV